MSMYSPEGCISRPPPEVCSGHPGTISKSDTFTGSTGLSVRSKMETIRFHPDETATYVLSP